MTALAAIFVSLAVWAVLQGSGTASTSPPVLNNAVCPEQFQKHGASCYRIFDLTATWIEAKSYCRVFGGDLAIIDSEAEQKLIETLLGPYQSHVSPHLYWLDGGDMLSEGDWRWFIRDGVTVPMVGYSNWYTGEPNNGATVEHCLIVSNPAYHYKWFDKPCYAKYSFICESSPLPQLIG